MILKELNALVAAADAEIRELNVALDVLNKMGDPVTMTVSESEGKGANFRIRMSNNRVRTLLENRLQSAQTKHAHLYAKVAQVNALLETLP